MFLIAVANPKLSSGILRVSVQACFLPRPSTFTGSCWTPKHSTSRNSWHRSKKIFMDSSECRVTSNTNIGRDIQQLPSDSKIPDGIPVLCRVSINRFCAQFELSSWHSSIFLPNVVQSCFGAGNLAMVNSKSVSKLAYRNFLVESNTTLPV